MVTAQVTSILLKCDPQRTREIPRPAAQIHVKERHPPATSTTSSSPIHQRRSGKWLYCANEYGSWKTLRLGNSIDQIVDPVVEVHICKTWWSIEWRITLRESNRSVTGRITFTDIRLDFNDPSNRLASPTDVYERLPDQVTGYRQRWASVERARKDSTHNISELRIPRKRECVPPEAPDADNVRCAKRDEQQSAQVNQLQQDTLHRHRLQAPDQVPSRRS